MMAGTPERKRRIELSRIDRLEVRLLANFLRSVSGKPGLVENPVVRFLAAIRTVSLPITAFSVIIGGLLASIAGGFNGFYFLLSFSGLILAHSASNLFNDWWDFKNRIDTEEYFRAVYNIHPVKLLGERKTILLAFVISFLAFTIGLTLAWIRGFPVIILALAGFVIMFSYSGKPLRLKYIGLGEPMVFLVWGPLMICGTYYVITSGIEWWVLAASLPYGLSATLILFGKHTDKIDDDRKKGVRTLPVILGEKRTLIACTLIILSIYSISLSLVSFINFSFPVLIVLVSLPRAIRFINNAFKGRPDYSELPKEYPKEFWPMWYVGGAFMLNTEFALSFISALIIEKMI